MFSERWSFSLRWANFRVASQFLGQGPDFWSTPTAKLASRSGENSFPISNFLAPQLLAALGWEKSCNTHHLQKLLFAPHCAGRAICSYYTLLFSLLWKYAHILGIKLTELWQELCHPDLPMVVSPPSSIFWIFHMNVRLIPESRNQQLLNWNKSQDWDFCQKHPRFLPTWAALDMPPFPWWTWKNAQGMSNFPWGSTSPAELCVET